MVEQPMSSQDFDASADDAVAEEVSELDYDASERGVSADGSPQEWPAVYGSTEDNRERHFLGWLGEVDPDVNPVNSAVFFLLGLYALLTTTHDWPGQGAMLEDYVTRTMRSIEAH